MNTCRGGVADGREGLRTDWSRVGVCEIEVEGT